MARELKKGDRVLFLRDDLDVTFNGMCGTVHDDDESAVTQSIQVAFDDDPEAEWRWCHTGWLVLIPPPDISSIETIEEYLNDPR